jgi:hypothetical protein
MRNGRRLALTCREKVDKKWTVHQVYRKKPEKHTAL